ncbi:enhancer of mRNA-decapping protein 3 [Zerene cesonia]|uniref:enhancer of mRNA-decapping protein 3 n=1 Tax=Zerene cesonia TaxID=33412 RepID=UPI0018E4FEB3|nr:enhancer of mRNA-decapping protein 3 [Zerene cesonia]
MSKWIGYAVSVNCGDPLGCYQGTILEADGNTITLTKAFRNGFPYPKSQVTLNAADIKDLKIIEEAKSEPLEQTHSTVAVTKNNKKGPRATVCENLQANSTTTGSQQTTNVSNKSSASRGPGPAPARSKPIDIQNNRNKNNNHCGSYGASTGVSGGGGGGGGGGMGAASSTPKQRGGHERARRRNEACFGDAADPALADDFDFEGNLALFDKQALWEEMRTGARPDVVRAADEAAAAAAAAVRLRHDENVLGAAPPPRATRLPGPCAHEYATDEGRRVPAAGPRARRALWAALRRAGAGVLAAALQLAARAAADLALRLAGGARRLEPRNAHQPPVLVVLAGCGAWARGRVGAGCAGAHQFGACGVSAARLAASHGARAHVLLAGDAAACAELRRELAAAELDELPVHRAPADLPAADVIVLALHDPLAAEPADGAAPAPGLAAALRWAGAARAAVLALEPPGAGWPGLAARATLVGGLPPAPAPALGRVFLANVAPPRRVLRDLGIAYRPPFGAASLLALN